MVLAERLRDRIEHHEFMTDGGPVRITVSLGIAQIPGQTIRTAADWIVAAEFALYEAKAEGGNGVAIRMSDLSASVESAVSAVAA